MSTYVMSDIHGHKSAFDKMLEKIEFGTDDELYVLGDIIDKGSESADMLFWAVEEAPDNIHFLLGNHEDMAYSALAETGGRLWAFQGALWERNDGFSTMRQIGEIFGEGLDGEKSEQWVTNKLLPWIDELPLYQFVDIGNRKIMLVHAGFDPWMFENVPDDEKWPDSFCDGNWDYHARRQMVEVPYGFGLQCAQNMLWERVTWHIDPHEAPLETVFGHTYFKQELIDAYVDYRKMDIRGGAGKIAHFQNKHAIDCGCAYARRDAEGCRQGLYNLGCLRLDDMSEFYVPIEAEGDTDGNK